MHPSNHFPVVFLRWGSKYETQHNKYVPQDVFGQIGDSQSVHHVGSESGESAVFSVQALLVHPLHINVPRERLVMMGERHDWPADTRGAAGHVCRCSVTWLPPHPSHPFIHSFIHSFCSDVMPVRRR